MSERRVPLKQAPILEKIANYHEDEAGCWVWDGAKSSWGYGSVRVDGVTKTAHRVSYELFVGPIPPGLTIDHLCRNRACINPIHMEPVTIKENLRRGMSKTGINSRKTACLRGHAFTPENTLIDNPKGWRNCRICKKESRRRYLKPAQNA